MKNLINKLEQDITNAKKTAKILKDENINEMIDRYDKFNTILKDLKEPKDFKLLKEYVKEIYNSIKWDNTNLKNKENYKNIDYKTFIMFIYTILSNNTLSYEINFEQERYQKIYSYIIEKIDSITSEE